MGLVMARGGDAGMKSESGGPKAQGRADFGRGASSPRPLLHAVNGGEQTGTPDVVRFKR